jgi:hypothetical protein
MENISITPSWTNRGNEQEFFLLNMEKDKKNWEYPVFRQAPIEYSSIELQKQTLL